MTMEGVHHYGIRLLITRLTRSRPASYFVSINQTIWPRQGDEKAELIVIDPSRHNYFNAELWRSCKAAVRRAASYNATHNRMTSILR